MRPHYSTVLTAAYCCCKPAVGAAKDSEVQPQKSQAIERLTPLLRYCLCLSRGTSGTADSNPACFLMCVLMYSQPAHASRSSYDTHREKAMPSAFRFEHCNLPGSQLLMPSRGCSFEVYKIHANAHGFSLLLPPPPALPLTYPLDSPLQ